MRADASRNKAGIHSGHATVQEAEIDQWFYGAQK